MKIHLAGSGWNYLWVDSDFFNFNRLESFYYIEEEKEYIHKYDNFLLDSGAFTFMSSSKGGVNWDEYIKKYAEFINQYNVKHFFELDIDSIVGIKEVERLRRNLEELTGKQ